MYFPKDDNIFGSDNIFKEINSTGSYDQTLSLTRTRWKTLSYENNRCDQDPDTEASFTQCITHYLEDKVGCSMGLPRSNPEVEG